jgi:hypothetical protein
MRPFWSNLLAFFHLGPRPHTACIRDDKQMRAKVSEQKIDKTLKDSFPASDPPSGY